MRRVIPPREPLTDGVVTVRLPAAEAGDVDAVIRYSKDKGQLDDSWLPMVPNASPEIAVKDWLEGWAGRPSHNGSVLVVTILEAVDFIGIVGFTERANDCVEMIYGIAPRWRRRGLASRAATLGARWALAAPSVAAVELRIGKNAHTSQHVARNAGFRRAGIVSQYVAGTGETFEDLRFILDHHAVRDP